MTGAHALDPVLRPRSVVVVGASSDPTKRGHQILVALEEAGYEGEVHAVNPRGGTILGRPVHPTLEEVPGVPDLAVVCTPAPTVPDVVAACGRKGIRGAVVLAVGFRESGAEGAEVERRLLEEARRGGVRVIGPNTSGLLNLPLGLNLVGARGVPAGSLSLVVQSGNMALALMNEVTARSHDGIGVAVGVGNQTDLGFAEYLDFLGDDPGTRAVMVYAEGFRDARAFLSVAARVAREKPVLVVKGARSDAGQAAARSHTGSVSGDHDGLRAGLAQAGVVEVERTDELLHLAETLAWQPPVEDGRALAILSDGGGQGTLASDALSEAGVPLAELAPDTRAALRALLGPAAGVANPVDLAGAADADPEVFGRALEPLLADPAVGGVLVVGLFGGYGIRFADSLTPGEVRAAEHMARAAAEAGKPLVVHSMYAPRRSEPLRRLGEGRVPVVESLEVACRCLAETWRRGRRLARPPWRPDALPAEPAGGAPPGPVEAARGEGRTTLTEEEARTLLEARGVAFAPATACSDADEVRAAAEAFGGPVAVKVLSPRIPHKSDAGGVALGLATPEAAVAAFRRVLAAGRAWLEGRGEPPEVPGVLVSPMLEAPLAELLVGARRHPDVGPVLTVGAGGVWVEVLRDVAHRVLPVDEDAIRTMLGELRTRGLLEGARGRRAADVDAVVRQAAAVARTLLEVPDVDEVEVNPLFVGAEGATAVDARIFLTREASMEEEAAPPAAPAAGGRGS